MSTKDFKQGMVAGAKPFGDKLDQLVNISESAVSHIREGIDGVSSVVSCILDDLSVQEKKAIYDLDTPQGIADLDQTEKEYLLSVLFTLANQRANLVDKQKFYLRTLKAHLEVANIQIGIDLGTIENIESITFQKIILQTIMEFLYLEYQNHDYMDDYEELIDCFSVNKRGIKEIQSAIDHMVNLLGIEGIACHYSPLAEPEITDETIEEIMEISADAESSDQMNAQAVSDTVTVLDQNIIVPQGDTRIIKNQHITIKGALMVCGHVIFENCYITSENGQLFSDSSIECLRNPSAVEFVNCQITDIGEHFIYNLRKVAFCDSSIKGAKSKASDHAIRADAIIRNSTFENIMSYIVVAEIENSKFINCDYISASCNSDRNKITGSIFENCDTIFIDSGNMVESTVTNASFIGATDANIQNCIFNELVIGEDDSIFPWKTQMCYLAFSTELHGFLMIAFSSTVTMTVG